MELFSHTLHLDLKFHLMRKTGEITRQLDRGTAAIQNVLSTVVFNIGPSIFDIAAASVYVAASLNVWVAIIVFVTMASYIPITVRTLSPPICFQVFLQVRQCRKSRIVAGLMVIPETCRSG